jgi:hypothetical protein
MAHHRNGRAVREYESLRGDVNKDAEEYGSQPAHARQHGGQQQQSRSELDQVGVPQHTPYRRPVRHPAVDLRRRNQARGHCSE